MELFTILLSGLLFLLSPVGLVFDKVGENLIRSQFQQVEQLEVRVDNAPSYQAIQGKINQIRIASRGVWLTSDLRIEALELETDPININIEKLRQLRSKRDLAVLEDPLQGGINLTLTEADVNRALSSPAVSSQLRRVLTRFLPSSASSQAEQYEILNPKIEFLENDRLRLQVTLQQRNASSPEQLEIQAESGLMVIQGHQLKLVNPQLVVNGKPVPALVLNLVTQGISRRLDLQNLEQRGITLRLLQLQIKPTQMQMAAFVRLQAPTTP